MIAPTAIIRGIGQTFGFDIIDVPNTTGYYNSDLNAKMETAVKAIKEDKYDFGFVHVKAVDDAGHDKNSQIKVEQLEKTDKAIKLLIDGLKDEGNEFIICVTGDHTTPVSM